MYFTTIYLYSESAPALPKPETPKIPTPEPPKQPTPEPPAVEEAATVTETG